MSRILVGLIATVVSAGVFAQAAQSRGSQGSSNPQGVQIQGNTTINAAQKNATAIAVGEGNEAKNTAGAIKGGTQIQGNTKINASQKNATAIAVGKNNKAENTVGQIGGK